jgi:hypothetical protein
MLSRFLLASAVLAALSHPALAQTAPADSAAPPAPPAAAPPPAAAAPAAAPAAPAAAAPAASLTGAAAAAAIAGNTLTGKVDGKEWTVFFANNGQMTMLEDSEQSQGKWELRGTKVCMVIKGENDECYDLEISGDVAMLKESETTTYRLTVGKGNTKNLPVAK